MRRAFTLVEVVVALSVMALMGVLVLTTLSTSFQLRDYLAAEDDTDRSARVALQRIEHEIKLAFLTNNKDAINTYRTVFIGLEEGDDHRVWFATMGHQRLYRDAREGDQAEITMWTESDPESADAMVLLHREAAPIDHLPDKDGVVLPLATGVRRFDLRYLDGQKGDWVDEWNSEKTEHLDRLPRAVEVTLVLDAPDPDDPDIKIQKTYLTTVLLDLAEPMQRSLFAAGRNG